MHGDIFNSDTRSALAILEIGDIKVNLKQQEVHVEGDLLNEMACLAPVLEDGTKKITGNITEILINCSLKDQR